jgi:hypothetical protein
MERKIGDIRIVITPESFSGNTVYLRVRAISEKGVGEEVVEYHRPPHQLPYVLLMGEAAKFFASKGTYKIQFGENTQKEIEAEIESMKALLLKEALEVIKGPVTLRRIVSCAKSVVFVSPDEPRSAFSVLQETFYFFFDAIAFDPSCLRGYEGVTICDPVFDDYSFTQDIIFAPSVLYSLLKEMTESKVRDIKRKIDKITTMSPEEAIKAWWITGIHVTEDGSFSKCPEFCDDCLWVEVWGAAPEDVKKIAPYYSVKGKRGRVYLYRKVDQRSFQKALNHPQLEEERKGRIKALNEELRRYEELLSLLEKGA